MNISVRLAAAGLVACLVLPQLAQAGGDRVKAYEIGEKFYDRKDYPSALKQYRKALAQNDVRAHYRLGLIAEAAGKDRDALKHYRSFVEHGQPESQRSDAARRIKTLEERLTRKTARPADLLLERGKGLFQKGDYREAERVLLQAASEDDSQPETHFYLGEVYMKLEAYGKAESEYIKARNHY